jgi:GNAT superfamily N-acetyltransferase
MSIVKLEHSDLKNQNKDLLVKIIYNNFLYLEPEPKLNHNPEAIIQILNSKDVILFLFMHQGKIGSYLLAQIINLDDSRKVLYISYIYVSKPFRTQGIGRKLMKNAEQYAYEKRCDGIMLIYDTRRKELRRFYDKLGFMLDFQLRRYENNDVFFKVI